MIATSLRRKMHSGPRNLRRFGGNGGASPRRQDSGAYEVVMYVIDSNQYLDACIHACTHGSTCVNLSKHVLEFFSQHLRP